MQRIGTSTVQLDTTPAILGFGSAAGKKEGDGPLSGSFDRVFEDVTLGEKVSHGYVNCADRQPV